MTESFLYLLRSDKDPVIATRKILNRFDIDGFFVFELAYPASILNCIGTLPSHLIKGIERNSFHLSDQVIHHLLAEKSRVVEPFFRSTIDSYIMAAPYETVAMRRHKQFMEYLDKSCCIGDIYYRPFMHDRFASSLGVFCLYGRNAPVFIRAVEAIESNVGALIDEFFNVASTRLVKYLQTVNGKNPAPIRVINTMVGKDLNAAETARLMQLHEVTINKHVASGKKAFGVNTMGGLVMECIREGYLPLNGVD